MEYKGLLKALTLELRHELEGRYDTQGKWQAGDLERRLASIGIRRNRTPVPLDELPHLPPEDREARRLVDAFLASRAEGGQNHEEAIADFVRESAYTWANRLLALRCMEARGLIDEVILQKEAYGGRSLQHQRLARKAPERCAGEDGGLFAALFDEFVRQAKELPLLFNPRAPAVALRPSVAALKRCIALLSRTEAVKGQDHATDEVFAAPDALGWTYSYWNTEEKRRVAEKIRIKKGAKIEGAEIIAFTCIMKAKEKAPDFVPRHINLVASNIHLPAGKDHVEAFLKKHPEDAPLKSALLAIFDGLAHANELGSLLQIEQPLEKELRYLREREPLLASETDWEMWKHNVMERVQAHFAAETEAADLSSAFFGEAATKGLSLVEILSRRYDVVATNPPYMGSKNMDEVVKRQVQRYYPSGRRDLYAAFILRCLELADGFGRVAMVTQQSWMFLRSFADLRAVDGETLRKAPLVFPGVVRVSTIETLAHLGEHAFDDPAAAGAFVTLFVLGRPEPAASHRLTAFRLIGPKGPEEKDELLRRVLEKSTPLRFQPLQADILNVPSAPLSLYHLSAPYFGILRLEQFGKRGDVCQGSSPDVSKHVRWFWETPQRISAWVPYAKGGGYRKWSGCDNCCARWPLFRIDPMSTVRGESHFFQEGLCYTTVARGKLGVRKLHSDTLFSDASSGIFLETGGLSIVAGEWNTHLFTFLARSVCGKLDFSENYLRRLPAPRCQEIPNLVDGAFAIKDRIVSFDPTERWFLQQWRADYNSIHATAACVVDRVEAASAVLHAIEGAIELQVFYEYGLAGDEVKPVTEETGMPAGWFPLIAGYEAIPELPDGLLVPAEMLSPLAKAPKETLSSTALAELRARLRRLYEGGAGAIVEEDEASAEEDDDEESEAVVSGALIPIPPETFIEELSQKLEVHPNSIYWLLKELREEGVVCLPELRRFVEDYFTVTVLRLLGHRWPRQIEVGEPVPDWADRDGIIPITECTGERALLGHLHERIGADYGADRVNAIEREFEEIMGDSLAHWLTASFFNRHISQFKKRPIAWHIQSQASTNSKKGKRAGRRKLPVLSCLVYYHRLDADLLPKLRTQYVGPLRSRLQTEVNSLERLSSRTMEQDVRRFELEESLAELKDFDQRLEEVIIAGFACEALHKLAGREHLDKWTSRDGLTSVPSTRDDFLSQERKYDPDLNDGVRVNIAPLQRAGLLAADVLAPKDVEKAIADRAEWRADERRWCREGKLPQPGWWRMEA